MQMPNRHPPNTKYMLPNPNIYFPNTYCRQLGIQSILPGKQSSASHKLALLSRWLITPNTSFQTNTEWSTFFPYFSDLMLWNEAKFPFLPEVEMIILLNLCVCVCGGGSVCKLEYLTHSDKNLLICLWIFAPRGGAFNIDEPSYPSVYPKCVCFMLIKNTRGIPGTSYLPDQV